MHSEAGHLKLLLILSLTLAAAFGTTILADLSNAEADELFDDSVTDVKGYIRSTGQLGGIKSTGSNWMAILTVESDTTYNVSITADTRFRVGTLNSANLVTDYFLENYHVSPLDDNGASVVGEASCTITSGADHDMMVIFYWTSGATAPAADIRSTISVRASAEITSEPDTGVIVGEEWTYAPATTGSGITISVSGADWLSFSEGIIAGTPGEIGEYTVTVTASRTGYADGIQIFTITAVNPLTFISTPSDGVIIIE
jgi:hypothetical protein